MKICDFCGTENINDAVKCSSCGSNSFRYKCSNCGTVFSEGVHCPHCGVKVGQEAKICPTCKTEYYSNACPTCGYIPGKENVGIPAPAYTTTQPAPPKRKTWLWVLGWIFIFPLPLTLILNKKPNIDKKVKYGVIAAAWVVYLIIILAGGAANKKEPKADKQNAYSASTTVNEATTKPTTVATTERPTDKPTEKPTEAPTKAPTEKPTQAPTEAPTPIVFTEYTNNVPAGSNAHVTIQGAPNTDYSIHVYYSSGESNAEGLEQKTSDDNGFVTWEWEVGTKTSKGDHSITVVGGGTRESATFTVN